MGSIFGSFGSVDEDDQSSMRGATVHREPDESAIRIGDSLCGPGVNRLCVADIQQGYQPLSNGAGDLHVVRDGHPPPPDGRLIACLDLAGGRPLTASRIGGLPDDPIAICRHYEPKARV